MKRFLLSLSAISLTAVLPLASSAMTSNEMRGWLRTTTQVVPQSQNPNPSIALPYVTVRGSNVAGYLLADYITHGFLSTDQEIVAIPIGSGGSMGNIAVLIFTVLGGKRRFGGYIPSSNGHLGVALREGQLEASTPIYGPGDPTCCPRQERITSYTLRGIRLVKVDDRVSR